MKATTYRVWLFLLLILALGCAKAKSDVSNDSSNGTDGVIIADDTAAPDATSDVSNDPDSGLLAVGQQCTSNKQCDTKLCVPADGTASQPIWICSRNCGVDDCPNDWECRIITLGADALSVCLPKTLCKISPQCEPLDSGQQTTTETESCGKCGTRNRSCRADCQWTGWSECKDEGVCSFGEEQTEPCGKCGVRKRNCSDTCQWSEWTECQNEKTCTPGQKEVEDCPKVPALYKCGKREKTCLATCEWSEWGVCQNEGACVPNSTTSEPCSQVDGVFDACLKRKYTCKSDCTWDTPSICQANPDITNSCGLNQEDPREPNPNSNDPEEVECWRRCGAWKRKCTNACTWGAFFCDNIKTCARTGSKSCQTSDECPNGSTCKGTICINEKFEDCGSKCGQQKYVCKENGVDACSWIKEGSCNEAADSCDPNQPNQPGSTRKCGLCTLGDQVRICSGGQGAQCAWDPWGECVYPGEPDPQNQATKSLIRCKLDNGLDNPDADPNDCICAPGTYQEQKDPDTCATRSRTCSANCTWNNWSDWQNPGVCKPGTVVPHTNEYCYKDTQTCNNQCQWDPVVVTTPSGECKPGQTWTKTSCNGQCGKYTVTCTSQCKWPAFPPATSSSNGVCDFSVELADPYKCKPGQVFNCNLCGTRSCQNNCIEGSCTLQDSLIDAYDKSNPTNNSWGNWKSFGKYSDGDDSWHNAGTTTTINPANDVDYYTFWIDDTSGGITQLKVEMVQPTGLPSGEKFVFDYWVYCRGDWDTGTNKPKSGKNPIASGTGKTSLNQGSTDWCCSTWCWGDDSIQAVIKVYPVKNDGACKTYSPYNNQCGSCNPYLLKWTQ